MMSIGPLTSGTGTAACRWAWRALTAAVVTPSAWKAGRPARRRQGRRCG
jgi:hypothetical protein